MTDTSTLHRRLGWVIGLTSTAYFMVVLDALVVVTALPRMQQDLHVGVSSLQWTVNAYGIAFAAGIISAAALGDRFGRRLVFNSGLALFTLASATCALAPSVSELIAAPMVVSPLAGSLSDRIGRRPVMLVGLVLQAVGYVWVAARGSLHTSWIELDLALFVAGIGISMALPTVPATVLDAVAPEEMGKASGINYMAQRFGTVFALAIASAVFATHGRLGSPAAVTAGFRPAIWACVCFAILAALSGIAITSFRRKAATQVEPASMPMAPEPNRTA